MFFNNFRTATSAPAGYLSIMNPNPEPSYTGTSGEALAMPHNLEAAVASHPFLRGLSPHNIKLLNDCAMLTTFEPNEYVFREGDPANRFYLIRSGSVSIECPHTEQGTTSIEIISGGDVLGWSWLFPPYYYHFDARALEHTEAIFFYGMPLREECESDHHFGYELMKRVSDIMMQRLQSTRRQMLKLSPR